MSMLRRSQSGSPRNVGEPLAPQPRRFVVRRLPRLTPSVVSVVPAVVLALGLSACAGSSSGDSPKAAGTTAATPAAPAPSASAAPSAPTKSCDAPTPADLASASAAPTSPADFEKLVTILLRLCTTPSTAANSPAVTGALGKAPTIAKPVGAPPTKLVIKDVTVGSGATLPVNGAGTFQYTGVKWADGTEFDSSWKTGKPFAASISGGVIPGWQIGLVNMKVGGRRELVVPPDLAYGTQAGNALEKDTLVFIVDLVSITPTKK